MSDAKEQVRADLDWTSALDEWQERSERARESDVSSLVAGSESTPKSSSVGTLGLKAMFDGVGDDTPAERASDSWAAAFQVLRETSSIVNDVDLHLFEEALAALTQSDVRDACTSAVESELHRLLGNLSSAATVLDSSASDWLLVWQKSRILTNNSDEEHLAGLREQALLSPSPRLAVELHLRAFELARSLNQSGEHDVAEALARHPSDPILRELAMASGALPSAPLSRQSAALPASVANFARIVDATSASDWLAVVNALANLSEHVGPGASLIGNAIGRGAGVGSRPFVSTEPSGVWDHLLQAIDERDLSALSACAELFREIDTELGDALRLLSGKQLDLPDQPFRAAMYAAWGDTASQTAGQAIAAEFIDEALKVDGPAPLDVERALRIGDHSEASAALYRWSCSVLGEDASLGVVESSNLLRRGEHEAAVSVLAFAAERTPDHAVVLELLRKLVPHVDYIAFLTAASEVSSKVAASHLQLEAAGLAADGDRLPYLVNANVGLEFVTALLRDASGSVEGWATSWAATVGDKTELKWAELLEQLEQDDMGKCLGLPSTRAAAAFEHERLADLVTTAERDALLLAAASGYLSEGQTDEALRALGATNAKTNAFHRVLYEAAEAQLSVVATATDELLEALRLSATSDDRNETRERLAWLDEMVRGDAVSALYSHLAIVEEDAKNRASLRRVARSKIDIPTWCNALAELALLIDEKCPEAAAHAELAAHPWSLRGDRDAMSEVLCSRLSAAADARIVSLRALALGAIDQHHLPDAEQRVGTLLERIPEARGLYADSLALLAFMHDDCERAAHWAKEAIAAEPDRVLSRLILPLATFANGDADRALDYLNELIEALPASSLLALKTSLLSRAVTFADHANRDPLRWLLPLVLIEPRDVESFRRAERLARTNLNVAAHTAILQARAEVATGEERAAIEIDLAEVFLESGDADQALAIVESALTSRPDAPEVLALAARAFRAADESAREEATLLRLVRRVSSEMEQVAIFSRLATLYTHHTVNLSRAEAASKEVLRRRPNDKDALELLVTIYRLQSDGDRAVAVQERRITIAAPGSDEARALTFELAEIHETVCLRPAKAEGVLERQREGHPLDVAVLERLASLLDRTGQTQARIFALERSVVEARRALEKGEDPVRCLMAIDKCYELSGKPRALTQGFLAAFAGRSTRVEANLTQLTQLELCRPEELASAVAAYFRVMGKSLDQMANVESGRDAVSLESQSALAAGAARAMKLDAHFALLASPGRRVLAFADARLLAAEPAFQDAPPKARTFLLIAALCHIAFGTSVMTRLDQGDLTMLIEASILGVSPSAFFDESKERSSRAALFKSDVDDVESPILALEVLGTFRNDWALLTSLFDRWACTAAWIAMGCDCTAAIEALAWRASLPPADFVKTDNFRAWLLHALRVAPG